MPINWRPATWEDIEPALLIQPDNCCGGVLGVKSALPVWARFLRHPFFFSSVIESVSLTKGNRLIGFGSAVIVSSRFAAAEIANPRPDITSRIAAGICSSQPVLATSSEVARLNAGTGVSVVILYNAWRDASLSPDEKAGLYTLLPSSLAECLAGFRVHRILAETSCSEATEFYQRSVVWQGIAEFPERGRFIHLMSAESVKAVPGSLGNVIFRFTEPLLRLRDSDQQLLLAALAGATDLELADALGVTFSAVKARWRSTFARISERMPALVADLGDREGRGIQKRHRVMAYVRNHPEELRPYDWASRNRPRDIAWGKAEL